MFPKGLCQSVCVHCNPIVVAGMHEHTTGTTEVSGWLYLCSRYGGWCLRGEAYTQCCFRCLHNQPSPSLVQVLTCCMSCYGAWLIRKYEQYDILWPPALVPQPTAHLPTPTPTLTPAHPHPTYIIHGHTHPIIHSLTADTFQSSQTGLQLHALLC